MRQFIGRADLLARRMRPFMDLANAITIGRARRRMTQSELAGMLGTTKSAISRLENGEHAPTLETLRRLSEALGLLFVIDPDGPHVQQTVGIGGGTPIGRPAFVGSVVVGPDPGSGGWVVRRGRERAIQRATQREALEVARQVLRDTGGRVEIQRRDGLLREVREIRTPNMPPDVAAG